MDDKIKKARRIVEKVIKRWQGQIYFQKKDTNHYKLYKKYIDRLQGEVDALKFMLAEVDKLEGAYEHQDQMEGRITRHMEEIDRLKKEVRLKEQFQFDARMEADRNSKLEKEIKDLKEEIEEYKDLIDELSDTKTLKLVKEGRKAIKKGTKGILFKAEIEDRDLEIKDLKDCNKTQCEDVKRLVDKLGKAETELKEYKNVADKLDNLQDRQRDQIKILECTINQYFSFDEQVLIDKNKKLKEELKKAQETIARLRQSLYDNKSL